MKICRGISCNFAGQTAATRSEPALSPTDTGMSDVHFAGQTAATSRTDCGTDRSYAKRTSSVLNLKRDVGCLPALSPTDTGKSDVGCPPWPDRHPKNHFNICASPTFGARPNWRRRPLRVWPASPKVCTRRCGAPWARQATKHRDKAVGKRPRHGVFKSADADQD